MYHDPDGIIPSVTQFLLSLPQPLTLIYGGDTPALPTIGLLITRLLPHLPGSTVIHTIPETASVPEATRTIRYPLRTEDDGSPVYGGVDPRDGHLRGATAVYLGREFSSRLAGVVALGGGSVALQEASYALERGLPLAVFQCEAKVPPVGASRFGPLWEWWASVLARGDVQRGGDGWYRKGRKESNAPSPVGVWMPFFLLAVALFVLQAQKRI